MGVTSFAALVMLGPGGIAAASPTNPTQSALNFGVFVEGDATLTSNESEGPVALGGDLTIGGNFQVGGNSSGTFVVAPDPVPSALVIGGQVDFAASAAGAILSVQNGAYAKLGDGANAQVLNFDSNNAVGPTHIVAGGATYESTPRVQLTVTQPVTSVLQSPIDFAAAFTDFRSSSAALATCTNTVILTDAQGQPLPAVIPPGTNAFITLADNTTNVLNITGANLNNLAALIYVNQPTATRPLLINVDTTADDTYDWDVPNSAGIGGGQAPFILWNFPTATQITQLANGATLEGTLYAPNADLIDNNSSNNEGQVITASITMNDGGEVHYFPFTATLNCAATSPSPTPTATATATPTSSPSASPSPSMTVSPFASPSMSPHCPWPTHSRKPSRYGWPRGWHYGWPNGWHCGMSDGSFPDLPDGLPTGMPDGWPYGWPNGWPYGWPNLPM